MDKRLSALVEKARRIVFFGGAGVSCESGIPDFRSQDGLYNQQYAYPPEEILSHHFFMQNPEEFYRFYRDKMLYPKAKPNAAHLKLHSGKSRENCVLSLHRILTACIKWRVPAGCTNCTEASTATDA